MNSIKFGYKEEGCGDIVLFLHGYGCNKNTMDVIYNCIKNTHHVVSLDLPGFGDTKVESDYDIYEYAIQVYLFCVNNNYKNINIVCHSFGGRIAIILSTLFDIKINKLVLIDVAGLKYRFNIFSYIKSQIFRLKKRYCIKKYGNTKRMEKYYSEDYRNSSMELKSVFVKVVNQYLNYLIKDISCSVIIVWGNDDKAVPTYMAKYLFNNIKSSSLYIINNAGHFPFINNPILCNSIIKSFLKN